MANSGVGVLFVTTMEDWMQSRDYRMTCHCPIVSSHTSLICPDSAQV